MSNKIKIKCEFCQKEVEKYPSALKDAKHYYCSQSCAVEHRKAINGYTPPTKKYFHKVGDMIDDLKILDIKNRKYTLQCTCGNTFSRRTDYIFRRKKNNQDISCGCKSKNREKGKQSRHWNGHHDISGQQWAMIQHSAAYRKIPFDVTIEDVWDQFIKQDCKCALTGIELSFAESRRTGQETTASLDRIDSKKPYTKENIQWIHKTVNKMKNNIPQDEFLYWCNQITKNSTFLL